MGERTTIAWTRSTGNPWIGCTEVSPGCDACYARARDARHRYGGATHWGAGVPRYERLDALTKDATLWNRKAGVERATRAFARGRDAWDGKPGFWPVFPSMCDPFDNEVPDEWHRRFWALISMTPNLTWLLLTKRIGNAADYIERFADRTFFPAPNVWIGASIVNQKEADRDLPKLAEVPAAKRFISYEPALGPVDFKLLSFVSHLAVKLGRHVQYSEMIDQIIVGGESHQGKYRARPFDVAWARSARDQCRLAGVAFFFKQAGSAPETTTGDFGAPPSHASFDCGGGVKRPIPIAVRLKDRGGADPAEWPLDLRAQEWPA